MQVPTKFSKLKPTKCTIVVVSEFTQLQARTHSSCMQCMLKLQYLVLPPMKKKDQGKKSPGNKSDDPPTDQGRTPPPLITGRSPRSDDPPTKKSAPLIRAPTDHEKRRPHQPPTNQRKTINGRRPPITTR